MVYDLNKEVVKVAVDVEGEHIIEIPQRMLDNLKIKVGDNVELCTDLYWCSKIHDYEPRITVRKVDE